MRNVFSSIMRARPRRTADRFIVRATPIDYDPILSPHALRIPSHNGHPAHRRITPSSDDALPPSFNIAPLVREPKGPSILPNNALLSAQYLAFRCEYHFR